LITAKDSTNFIKKNTLLSEIKIPGVKGMKIINFFNYLKF